MERWLLATSWRSRFVSFVLEHLTILKTDDLISLSRSNFSLLVGGFYPNVTCYHRNWQQKPHHACHRVQWRVLPLPCTYRWLHNLIEIEQCSLQAFLFLLRLSVRLPCAVRAPRSLSVACLSLIWPDQSVVQTQKVTIDNAEWKVQRLTRFVMSLIERKSITSSWPNIFLYCYVESTGFEGMRSSSRFKLLACAIPRIEADSSVERLLHQ